MSRRAIISIALCFLFALTAADSLVQPKQSTKLPVADAQHQIEESPAHSIADPLNSKKVHTDHTPHSVKDQIQHSTSLTTAEGSYQTEDSAAVIIADALQEKKELNAQGYRVKTAKEQEKEREREREREKEREEEKQSPPHIFDAIKDKIILGAEDTQNVLRLASQKEHDSQQDSSFTTKLFALLFPSSKPAVNALLATAYISGPPNFLLALCPPNIDPSSLSVMVAFAVGGLLGDTFFHLLPEIFLGEDESPTKVRLVALEPNRNLLLGVFIFIGLATFMAMDKALRIATGGGHSHSHDHDLNKQAEKIDKKIDSTDYRLQDDLKGLAKTESHDDHKRRLSNKPYNDTRVAGEPTRKIISDLAATNEGIRRRSGPASSGASVGSGTNADSRANAGAAVYEEVTADVPVAGPTQESEKSDPTEPTSLTGARPHPHVPGKDVNPSVKLAGLLNLIADFTHNITDGLALSTSFYSSPALGATTTMAVFFHEIPHEVGDFALLIQSGFSKRSAMGAQFVTAVGAFLGTLIGILVQEYGSGEDPGAVGGHQAGLLGTSLQWADMLLPFTAGTFLYVGTVGVIPELLENESGSSQGAEVKRTLMQFAAMAVGALIMIVISWS